MLYEEELTPMYFHPEETPPVTPLPPAEEKALAPLFEDEQPVKKSIVPLALAAAAAFIVLS
jgi:hypothetical protein